MSAFDTLAKDAARDMVQQVGHAGTFAGADGEVITYGLIDKAVDYLGAESVIAEDRWTLTLLAEDVAEPTRGDRWTDDAGAVWLLQERQPGTDRWFHEWTVTRQ